MRRLEYTLPPAFCRLECTLLLRSKVVQPFSDCLSNPYNLFSILRWTSHNSYVFVTAKIGIIFLISKFICYWKCRFFYYIMQYW